MKEALKDTVIFSICYFIIFGLFIHTFSDGSETAGMFIIIDFFAVIVLTFYYLLTSFFVKYFGKTIPILTKGILLFLLAEFAVLTFTGQLPVFGLLEKYVYSRQSFSGDKWLDNELSLFQQKRDFAFSISGLTSSVFYLIFRWLTNNNSS